MRTQMHHPPSSTAGMGAAQTQDMDSALRDATHEGAGGGEATKALRWFGPFLLGLMAVACVRAGLIDLSRAIWLGIALEGLLVVVEGRLILRAVARYRRERTGSPDAWLAVERGLAELLPRPVARLLAIEVRLWWHLGRWVLRSSPPPGFAYHARSAALPLAVLGTIVIGSALLLAHVLVPAGLVWLRMASLLLAIEAMVWGWGLVASQRLLPHELGDRAVRLRYGALLDVRVPYEAVARAEILERIEAGGGREGLQEDRAARVARICVGGAVNVRVALARPLRLPTPIGATEPVGSICLWADEPRDLVRAINGQLASTEVD